MKSIIQYERACYICGCACIEEHHICFGPNRKVSEKLGLKVWLCPEHHRGNQSPHQDKQIDLEFKRMAQSKFMETHSFGEWMNEIGRNYLDI